MNKINLSLRERWDGDVPVRVHSVNGESASLIQIEFPHPLDSSRPLPEGEVNRSEGAVNLKGECSQ